MPINPRGKCEFEDNPYIKHIEVRGGTTNSGETIVIETKTSCPIGTFLLIYEVANKLRLNTVPKPGIESELSDKKSEVRIKKPVRSAQTTKHMLEVLAAGLEGVLTPEDDTKLRATFGLSEEKHEWKRKVTRRGRVLTTRDAGDQGF